MIMQNLHTHSLYCDGNDSLRDMVEEAIYKGFDSIGFSGHIYTDFDTSYCMSIEDTIKYDNEIKSLKDEYKDKIKIYHGIEKDYFSTYPTDDFQYTICSVHYILSNDEYIAIDLDVNYTKKIIHTHFDDNCVTYAKKYFDTVIEMCENTNFDILGHFDLVSKFCKDIPELSCKNNDYKKLAIDTVNEISKKHKVFEVNTGAISRGYRKSPYPDFEILKEMNKCGMTPIITSDCHNKKDLDCNFKEAFELIKAAGFKHMAYFNGDKFLEQSIK